LGVSRNITIIVYTNIETSYELIQKFLIGFWIKSNSSVVNTFYDDETDNEILPKEIEFDKLETIFKKREILNKVNIISFSVDTLNEGIILSINNLENTFNDDKMFEIWISPGAAHKLKEYERNTDFSYYLNLVLPRFKEIGCYPSEIMCSDIG